MNTDGKNIAKQGFWNAAGIISWLMSNWLIMMLLPKVTDYEKTGFYSLAFSTSQLFYIISVFSLRDFQVITNYKEISEKSFFSFRLYTSFFSLIVSIFSIIFLGYTGNLFFIILIFLISNTIIAFSEVIFGTFQKIGRLEITGYIGLITAICKISFFFISIKIFKNFYIALICGEFIPSIIYFLITYLFYLKYLHDRPHFSFKCSKNFFTIISNTLPLLGINFITLFITTYPRIIIEKTENPTILGYYSILISIANIIPTITTQLFAPLLAPYASLYKNKEFKKLAKIHFKVFILSILLCLVILLISFYFIPYLFKWYYGNELIEYINIFFIGIFGACFLSLAQVSRPILICAGKNKLMLIIISISVIPLLVCTPILVKKYSAFGAAYALLFSYILYFFLSTLITSMILYRRIKKIIRKM